MFAESRNVAGTAINDNGTLTDYSHLSPDKEKTDLRLSYGVQPEGFGGALFIKRVGCWTLQVSGVSPNRWNKLSADKKVVMPDGKQERRNRKVLNRIFTGNRLFLVVLAIPLLGIAILDHDSLLTAWNQGRGGFVFATFFLALEYFDSRDVLKSKTSRNRIVISLTLGLLTLVYFVASSFGLHATIEAIGKSLGVPLIFSWIWIWDYLAFLFFLLALIPTLFGINALRLLPSGNVYLLGMTMILSLDAFFPFDSLGPLQAVVPIILQSVAFLIRFLNIGLVAVSNNMMVLDGNHGTFSISVFWPSAGVHSILIYSLIMFLFLIKIRSTTKRKSIYFAIGAFGTFMVNILRIFSLSAYVLLVSADKVRFEEFHAIAGEILFLPWLLVFLFFVSKVESSIVSRQDTVLLRLN